MNAFRFASIFVIAYLTVLPAHGTTVTFESVNAVDNPIYTSLTTQGFTFTSDHFHAIGTDSSLASNGSLAYIAEEEGGLGKPIQMKDSSAATFSLNSFDGAELFIVSPGGYPNATSIRVVGSLFGGGTVSTQFNLDGVIDGIGNSADFQTFLLPGSFTNLTDVTFHGMIGNNTGGFSIDNIVASVPEPAAVLQIIAAFLALSFFRHKS